MIARWPRKIQATLAAFFQRKLFPWMLLKCFSRLRVGCHLAPLRSVDDLFERLQTVTLLEPEALAPPSGCRRMFIMWASSRWQPAMDMPESLKDVQGIVYITMGTSANPRVFRPLIEAFGSMPELSPGGARSVFC